MFVVEDVDAHAASLVRAFRVERALEVLGKRLGGAVQRERMGKENKSENDEMKQDAHVCVSLDVADEGEVAGAGVADVCVDGDGAACVSGDVIRELCAGDGGGVGPTECGEDGHGADGGRGEGISVGGRRAAECECGGWTSGTGQEPTLPSLQIRHVPVTTAKLPSQGPS